MPKGGIRPGGGRPKKTQTTAETWNEARIVGPQENKTPLEYMLGVMNDPGADLNRRDRMAQAAAPYVHARADAVVAAKGKKEQAEEAAQSAGHGTTWGDDLAPRIAPLN